MRNPSFSILVLVCFQASSVTLALSIVPSNHPKVAIWDNVVPEPARKALHEAAKATGLGHRAFRRPLMANANLVERTLDVILTEMGDFASGYVEYWSRQEWRHIEAHADVDEALAKQQDRAGSTKEGFRYPDSGHVLYLKVGTEVRGPTCIFPNHSTGGQLADGEVELVTVPAVEGRLLRFEGNLLHAVPRPTDIWFLPFVQGGPDFAPEETYGRSVILFNTWSQEPPMDVPLNVESCEAECVDKYSAIFCYNRSEWQAQRIVEIDDKNERGKRRSAKIWLLGNERRRDFTMRTVNLEAPGPAKDALYETSTPRKATLDK
jgi:hypothetical protein